MESIKINNATVVGVTDENVKMRNDEWRRKETVLFTENGANGTMLHGCVVWDENIGKLGLQQGKVYNLQCRLVGRQWGGRFQYELVAFRAEEVQKDAAQGADPQPSVEPISEGGHDLF